MTSNEPILFNFYKNFVPGESRSVTQKVVVSDEDCLHWAGTTTKQDLRSGFNARWSSILPVCQAICGKSVVPQEAIATSA